MLLDYIQIKRDDKDILSVSYYKDGKTKIKDIPLNGSDMYNWKVCYESNPDKSTKYRNWNNKPVRKIKTNKLSEFRIGEILDNLPKEEHDEIFDYVLPNIYFVDIETEIDSELSVKESAQQARKPITVIGIATPTNEVVVLSSEKNLTPIEIKNVELKIKEHTEKYKMKFSFRFRSFSCESDMLKFFLKHMVSRFPMMSGWNFVDFDWAYIVNRCKRLNIDISIASPINKVVGRDKFPAHVAVIDYMECYKKWDTSVTKENLKLDQAGLDVLGVQKVNYSGTLDELYRDDFAKYVYYNAIDCALVAMLHNKLGVSSIGNMMTYISKCPTMNMFSPVKLTEAILARDYYAQNKVLASDYSEKIQQAYRGAYVKAPITGFHRCCICNDFASLYPNIIRELNLSPETFVSKIEETDTEKKLQKRNQGYIVSESGCVFDKNPGVFSTLVGRVYNQRKSYKKIAVDASIKARLLEDLLNSNLSDEEAMKRYDEIMNK